MSLFPAKTAMEAIGVFASWRGNSFCRACPGQQFLLLAGLAGWAHGQRQPDSLYAARPLPTGANSSPRLSATALLVMRPRCTLSPLRKCGFSSTAAKPLLASISPNGSVALLSAWLDVTGTAPGMLATQ